MATEAQVRANQANAQRSPGPRTAEGKATAAQNSLKHGLFAREGVIRGEDRQEYEMHREVLLEQLDPVGPLEAILAARVVDLTWRLRRAAQDQNEAFGALYDQYVARQPAARPEAGSGDGTGLCVAGVPPARVEGVPPSNRGPEALDTRGQDARDTDTAHGQSVPPTRSGDARGTHTADERGAVLGRMILADFGQDAVLERLLRYERRIESSLYRTLKELRHVHDQGQQADQEVAGTLQRWRQEDAEARKARAFACDPPLDDPLGPGGGTTNTPGAEVAYPSEIPAASFTHPVPDAPPEDEMCKTNPISEGVSSWKCEVSGESCKTNPISPSGTRPEGREAPEWALVPHDSTIPFFQHSHDAPAAPDQLCKTNPILPDPAPSPGW